jgi:deoxyribonuclease-4
MLFGAHVSVSAGYESALSYALQVGCECIQIFAKSPRQWRATRIDVRAADEFERLRHEIAFGPVFIHTAYLLNLSTTNEELYDKSAVALADELRRGSLLAAAGVVTHIGNVPDGDREAAAQRVATAILRAFDMAGGDACRTRLLLENTAGAGTTFGRTFAEIGACISSAGLNPDKLGMCLDTCHAFAYGYPVDTASGWEAVIEDLSASVGLDRLGLIHANDCKFERGANRDRHEWIGDGHIGFEGFEAMVCERTLASVPVVTEMPGEIPEKDAVNLERLKRIRAQCPPSQ